MYTSLSWDAQPNTNYRGERVMLNSLSQDARNTNYRPTYQVHVYLLKLGCTAQHQLPRREGHAQLLKPGCTYRHQLPTNYGCMYNSVSWGAPPNIQYRPLTQEMGACPTP